MDSSSRKALRSAPRACYASTVYSTRELALKSVTEAIDALEARRHGLDPADLETQVAAVWTIMAEMDPELAKHAARYAGTA